MSDAGKAMLDANGDLIKGVGGVVLADVLYPMTVNSWLRDSYNRNLTGSLLYTSAAWPPPVFAENWTTTATGTEVSQISGSELVTRKRWLSSSSQYEWATGQRVVRYYDGAHTSGDVPFSRLAEYKLDYTVSFSSSAGSGIEIKCNIYLGTSGCTAPSGSNEPWEGSGWTLIDSTALTDGSSNPRSSGTINLPKADEFWLAFVCNGAETERADPAVSETIYSHVWTVIFDNLRLKYNLAT